MDLQYLNTLRINFASINIAILNFVHATIIAVGHYLLTHNEDNPPLVVVHKTAQKKPNQSGDVSSA